MLAVTNGEEALETKLVDRNIVAGLEESQLVCDALINVR